MTQTLFAAPSTMFSLPLSHDFQNARAAVVGIPFDCGLSSTRFGSRMGPNAIRHASVLTRELLQDADIDALDRVIDAGNVVIASGAIHSAFDAIEQAMGVVLDAGCVPLTLGGDGSVSLPQMRAIHKAHGPVAVLHFDAHTDSAKLATNDHYDNAIQFTHAAHESLIDLSHALHIGTRAPVNAANDIAYTRSLGYEVIPYDVVSDWGEEKLIAHMRERMRGQKVYLCFDMDFFDPSVAPGVQTPTPGGALAAEGLALVRGLKGLDIVALDINTVTPLHDPAGVTATLAASVAGEMLALLKPRPGLG
ncbi:MAG: arginase family protein [Pseudomonadota bacterium]